ncbi:MAG TPA: DinB family protein [Bryobacteraceae bacterium]|nr:DinB family protein [Bryobacteraceae bacterium]
MVRLEHVLDSWRTIRQDTVAAVEDFPAAEFDFRPVPEVATFGEIARHILNAGHALTGLMLTGDVNFATPDFRERMSRQTLPLAPSASPAELAAALRESIAQRTAALAAQPAEFYGQIMTRMDGQQVTRLEMLQMVKEHELTHRAQLFVYLRMKGIVPAPTRRRLAKAAAK